MTRPATHPTSELVYAELGGALTRPDEVNGWALLLVDALGRLLGRLDDVIRPTETDPAWAPAVDVDLAPFEALPWLAQWVGEELADTLTDAQRRDRIRRPAGPRRGSPKALREAVAEVLTGGRTVLVDEVYGGNPHRARVRTYASQTPDAAAAEAVADAAAPGWVEIVFELLAGQTHTQAQAKAATYADATALWPTYQAALEDIA